MVVAFTAGFTGGPVEYKYSGIFLVAENFIKGCFNKLAAQLGSVTMAIKVISNLFIAASLEIHGKDYADSFRFALVDDIFVRTGFYIITQGRFTSRMSALEGRFPHAFHDFAAQVFAVVFGHGFEHGFQDDTLRAIIQGLGYGDKPDAFGS
nr:hypothetical protein [Moorella sp. E308F]